MMHNHISLREILSTEKISNSLQDFPVSVREATVCCVVRGDRGHMTNESVVTRMISNEPMQPEPLEHHSVIRLASFG